MCTFSDDNRFTKINQNLKKLNISFTTISKYTHGKCNQVITFMPNSGSGGSRGYQCNGKITELRAKYKNY